MRRSSPTPGSSGLSRAPEAACVERVELLDPRRHDRNAFACGQASLDDYLQRQAAQHHRDGIATTHVLVDDVARARILGYCTLSAAQLLLSELAAEDQRRLPRYPVPAVRMGRLAVLKGEHGKGYGAALLANAVKRCLSLRRELGVRVLLVDALNDEAVAFYRLYGFRVAGNSARALYLPLGRAQPGE